MAATIQKAAVDHALNLAKRGDIDHGGWIAPNGSDREPMGCLVVDVDAAPAARLGYPVTKGGKVSAAGVAAALGRARTNMPSLVPALETIDKTIKSHEPKETQMSRIELARKPMLARCPGPYCGSHDIERTTKDGEGPTDRCRHCGRKFPHKPGTITAMQLSEDDEDKGGVNMTPTEPDPELDDPATPADSPDMHPALLSRESDCSEAAQDASAIANRMGAGAMRMMTKTAHADAAEAHDKAAMMHKKAMKNGPDDDKPFHEQAAAMHQRHADMHRAEAEKM
nr:hypothetical protein [uncultured Rhodopila sp.]